MRRMLSFITTCAVAALMLAPTALAQSPDVPAAGVGEDGSVTVGGDVGTDCAGFAASVEDGFTLGLTADQTQGVLDRCEQLGFLPSDGTSTTSASASAASASPAAAERPPADVVVGEDGQVTIDGDMGTDCRSFAMSTEDGFAFRLAPEQIEAVLVECERLGFLASGDTSTTSASASASPAPAGRPRADVVVSEGGQVTVDGDQGTDCRSFAISVEEGYTLGLTPEQIRDVLTECERLGFLGSDDATSTATATASASASPVPQPSEPQPSEPEPSESAESIPEPSTPEPSTPEPSAPEPSASGPEVAAAPGGVLPETGGPALLLLPVAVLLTGAGVLGITVSRRRN